MFILFDSNVWISELGLRSEDAAVVRHYVKRWNATVVIPEVVELEFQQKLTERLLKSREHMERGQRELVSVFGTRHRLDLPSEDDIQEAVRSLVLDLDVPTRRIPLNVDAARSSMLKLLQKKPPSKFKEQFRDGVIWAHCMELLAEGDVYLVSNDTGFFDKYKYDRGLARELVEEMEKRGTDTTVKLIRNLTELLDDIRIPITLDVHRIFDVVRTQEAICDLLTTHGFELSGAVEGRVDCFATEKADETYFRIVCRHPCEDVTGEGRQGGELRVGGSGFVDASNEVTEVRLSNILLDYPDWQPGDSSPGAQFAAINMGAPDVYRVRIPLEQG